MKILTFSHFFGRPQYCWLVIEVIGRAPDVMMLVVAFGEVTSLKSSVGGDSSVRVRAWMTVLLCCHWARTSLVDVHALVVCMGKMKMVSPTLNIYLLVAGYLHINQNLWI